MQAISAHRTAWSSSASGQRLEARLIERANQIADFPNSGRKIPEFQAEHLREILEQGYRIMYEVFPDRIEVFGVISSRQDLTADD
jgi:toxin ParE1/3/4